LYALPDVRKPDVGEKRETEIWYLISAGYQDGILGGVQAKLCVIDGILIWLSKVAV